MPWIKTETIHAAALIVTIIGMLAGAYFSLRSMEEAMQVQIAGLEARLVIAERAITTRQDAEERFAAEMRAALAVIQNGVADLRVQEAKRR